MKRRATTLTCSMAQALFPRYDRTQDSGVRTEIHEGNVELGKMAARDKHMR